MLNRVWIIWGLLFCMVISLQKQIRHSCRFFFFFFVNPRTDAAEKPQPARAGRCKRRGHEFRAVNLARSHSQDCGTYPRRARITCNGMRARAREAGTTSPSQAAPALPQLQPRLGPVDTTPTSAAVTRYHGASTVTRLEAGMRAS